MEEVKEMTMLKFVISLAMVVESGMAANYTVGGPNGGWDTTSNVQTWPSSQTFRVGDNLIFQYSATHDVVEVSKSDYDSCQTSNVIQRYNDGNTVIGLSSAGKRYFICETPGHCTSGMKLQVDTTADTTTSPSVQPPTSSANPPRSSPLPVTSTNPLVDAPFESTHATSPSIFPPPPSPSAATTNVFHFYLKYGIGLVMILPFAI